MSLGLALQKYDKTNYIERQDDGQLHEFGTVRVSQSSAMFCAGLENRVFH